MGESCLICDKHRGVGRLVGPVVFANELVVVSHRPLTEGRPVPGYLFVETRRHVATVADLTASEAAEVGRAVSLAAHALRAALAPEYVFSAIAGRSVAHFHQHVFARPKGTPAETPWFDVDSWEEGPRLDGGGLIALSNHLASHVARATESDT